MARRIKDTVAVEKLNPAKTRLESLPDKLEPKVNHRGIWSFNWAGVIIGLIATGVALLLVNW